MNCSTISAQIDSITFGFRRGIPLAKDKMLLSECVYAHVNDVR